MLENINGSYNTAIGTASMCFNTTGMSNTSLGSNSLEQNTTGYSNTAVGALALYFNTGTYENTAVGVNALYNNNASQNTAVGAYCLQDNQNGDLNTAVGATALTHNTTGQYNTSIGFNSMARNTTGTNNTAVGINALQFNIENIGNTAVGADCFNTTTAIFQGTYCTAIGYSAATNAPSAPLSPYTNSSYIGFSAQPVTGNNEIILGNSSISYLYCAASITSPSDARDKKDIESLKQNSGIDFVNKLNPVDFVWNMRDGGKVDIKEQGFIAQELQQVQEETNIHVPSLVDDSNPDKLQASYTRLIPVMVQAIKDLKSEIDTLKQQLASCKDM